jgi:hypothetical protein
VDDLTALALAARGGDRVALSSVVRRTRLDVARLVTAVAGCDPAGDAPQGASPSEASGPAPGGMQRRAVQVGRV